MSDLLDLDLDGPPAWAASLLEAVEGAPTVAHLRALLAPHREREMPAALRERIRAAAERRRAEIAARDAGGAARDLDLAPARPAAAILAASPAKSSDCRKSQTRPPPC